LTDASGDDAVAAAGVAVGIVVVAVWSVSMTVSSV
jgi:hypothetical protein